MPPVEKARELAVRAADVGAGVTLVVPFLTEAADRVLRLVEELPVWVAELEVVCSDRGLLRRVAESKLGSPVVGRLLTCQPSDPRLVRLVAPSEVDRLTGRVTHVDGTVCELVYRGPPNEKRCELVRRYITPPATAGVA